MLAMPGKRIRRADRVAFLAGLAEDVWPSPAAVDEAWSADGSFTPTMDSADRAARRAAWHRAVERSRDWARDEPAT